MRTIRLDVEKRKQDMPAQFEADRCADRIKAVNDAWDREVAHERMTDPDLRAIADAISGLAVRRQ